MNFEQEVGHDTTVLQARILGRLTCLFGALIALLVLVPNPWWGRVCLLGCAAIPLLTGGMLLIYARRHASHRQRA